jgi:starch phosphorylase
MASGCARRGCSENRVPVASTQASGTLDPFARSTVSPQEWTMQRIRKFIVTPNLPPKLQPLLEIARNVWWVWNPEAINLLRRVDPDLWEERHHNPVAVLGNLTSDRISDLTRDQAFLAHLDAVYDDLQQYLKQTSWFDAEHEHLHGSTVAYFSFEFGLHESVALYSGGLGILAGDHL